MFAARKAFFGGKVPAPTITSFNPASRTAGAAAGNVTVNGTNFVSGATTVTVNGAAQTTTFVSATQLTVSFPSLGRGVYSVVVTTPGGSASANYQYTLTPSISSVSPSSQYLNINTTYTVSGSNFINAGASSVYCWETGVYYSISVASNSSLSFTANFGVGNKTIAVVAPDGWSNQATISVVNYPAPSVSSVSDGRSGNGSLTGSAITVSGSNFNIGTTSVSIGGTAVSASVSASSISFTCPNLGSDGAKTISISTGGGSTSTSVQFWAARAGSLVVAATSGSGSYTPPQWANFMDVVVRGGGGGGGSGSGGLSGRWGGGGSAGGAGGGTVNLVSSGFGARAWSVGGGGAGQAAASSAAGGAGGTSSAAGFSGGGGAGGCSWCNGAAGAAGSALTVGQASSPAPTGGGSGNSAQPGANPGSGGGGGNSAFGPFVGIAGRGGAVYIAIRQ